MATAYDVVRYPSWPIPETHPAALAVFAALYGLSFVPFERCRVLEIGCGEGVNLMGMAIAAPDAQFVGVDLADVAIAAGRETAKAAGLTNVTLDARDLLAAGPDLGRFDYIVAHGFYAWVPAPVRKAMMQFIGQSLSPEGLAFVSYNAYPGCRVREVLRDIMLDATQGIDDPKARLDAAHAVLRRQIASWSETDAFQHALIKEAEGMLKRPPQVLFHDELGPVYAPQYIEAVVAAARAEGLDYVCDATAKLNAEALWPSERFEAARSAAGGDWARFEQLMDFTEARAFRHSVFCRAGRPIDRRFVPERVHGLWVTAEIEPLKTETDGGVVFRAAHGAEFETRVAKFADFLTRLGQSYPVSLPFADIAGEPEIVEGVVRLFTSGMANLSTRPSQFVATPGERPVASPLARAQAASGEVHLASLAHKPVQMENALSRTFITLLDGTRTRHDLAVAVANKAGMSVDQAAERVPGALAEMTRLGFMMG